MEVLIIIFLIYAYRRHQDNKRSKSVMKKNVKALYLKDCCYADELHLRLENDEDRIAWKVWLDRFSPNDLSTYRGIIILLDKNIKVKTNEILESGHLLLSLPSVFFIIEKTKRELKANGLLKIYQLLYSK